VRSVSDTIALLQRGLKKRVTRQTDLNDYSSRSTAVFQLFVTSFEKNQAGKLVRKRATLSMVDLAGSESLKRIPANDKCHKESKYINQSLQALGRVIISLSEGKSSSHTSYRDSLLTKLLKDSLGGDAKTVLLATVSPSEECFQETMNTLRFANRAMVILNKPKLQQTVQKDSGDSKQRKSKLCAGDGDEESQTEVLRASSIKKQRSTRKPALFQRKSYRFFEQSAVSKI